MLIYVKCGLQIDNVRLPSWQAQLAGSKRWLLVPPPECYLQCRRFDVVVQQGDISEKSLEMVLKKCTLY